jgi:hypothetical protein
MFCVVSVSNATVESGRHPEYEGMTSENVPGLNARERRAAGLVETLADPLQQPSSSSAGIAPAVATLLDSLYYVALAHLEQEKWAQAAFIFEKILYVQPNYRDVVDRLALARVRMSMARIKEPAVKIEKPAAQFDEPAAPITEPEPAPGKSENKNGNISQIILLVVFLFAAGLLCFAALRPSKQSQVDS